MAAQPDSGRSPKADPGRSPPPAGDQGSQPEVARAPSPRYPRERETDVALRDGSTVHVRPVRPQDRDAIRTFLKGVSPDSIALRFFGLPNLSWVVDWSVDVDYIDRFALVAETGAPPRIVAHAAYMRSSPTRAEIAFLVADALQGHGISTALLAHLAEVAQRHGITTFTAEVLPENNRMLEVYRRSGFPIELRSSPGLIEVELPTALTPTTLAYFDERERAATVAAVRSVLEPRSVAIIGAGRARGTIGGEIVHNMLRAGFTGHLYAVNPAAATVQGLRSYTRVSEITEQVDLAVVAVPAAAVLEVARDCERAGVRALIVISSGFAETGRRGAHRQQQLVEICRAAGMRIVGPNCLGALNTSPGVRLNATFAAKPALEGSVGFMSQSGGLGVAIIEAAARLGIGLSSFISVGNKADLSGNDMLRYWEQDPNTTVAMLYLESFGNPRKFARIAPRFARKKPLLAVKSGRSNAGARATGSHTGALLSASDVTVGALFEQAGVIRADTLHELFSVAQLLTTQPVPAGARVAIVTNSGGPGAMCADACHADGVEVPALEPPLQARLAGLLPAGASVSNPIDLLASCAASDYEQVLEALAEAGSADAILAIFVPALETRAAAVAAAIRDAAERHPAVTFAAVFMTADPPPGELRSTLAQVPGYEFPEDAAHALALAARYGRWRARPLPAPVALADIRPERAAALISEQLAHGPGWMADARVAELLECYGLERIDLDTAPLGGVELLVGVASDPNFGPVLACGAGGAVGELSHDVSVRLTPIAALDAHEMVRALRTFPLLDGYADTPRCDVASLERLLLRVSAIVETHREIVALDLKPVVVSPQGTQIAAARLRVGAPPPAAPIPSLRG